MKKEYNPEEFHQENENPLTSEEESDLERMDIDLDINALSQGLANLKNTKRSLGLNFPRMPDSGDIDAQIEETEAQLAALLKRKEELGK